MFQRTTLLVTKTHYIRETRMQLGYIKDAAAVPMFLGLFILIISTLTNQQRILSMTQVFVVMGIFCFVATVLDGIFTLYPELHCYHFHLHRKNAD